MPRFLVSLLAFTLFPFSALAAADFTDIANTLYEDGIQYLFDEEIVTGYSDGSFRPNSTINRAEFTKIVILAVYSENTVNACDLDTLTFSDVSASAWYAPYICLAAEKNIIDGYSDNTFRPTKEINFVEASKVIVNTLGDETAADPEVWYKPFVLKLGEAKAIPTAITSFSHFITRGEMAEMIWRIQENIKDKASTNYYSLAREEEPEADTTCSINQDSCASSLDEVNFFDPDYNNSEVENFELDEDQVRTEILNIINDQDSAAMVEIVAQPSGYSAYELEVVKNNLWKLLLESVNEERTQEGSGMLVYKDELSAAAQTHAEDMLANDYFSHTDLDGRTHMERIQDTGYFDSALSWGAAENIAWGQASVEDVMLGWMNSAGHRENILNPDYLEFGLGLACGETVYDCYWVQTFAYVER